MYKIIGANQAEYGPVTAGQLRQWIAEGRADANTRAQLAGTAEWKPLREFPEFANLLTTQLAPPPLSGAPPLASTAAPMPPVPNYLVQAILCTICACMPCGVVAMVYAFQVNTKLQQGDYPGALAASKKARLWCWIAFILCILGLVVSMLTVSKSLLTP